MIDVKLFRIVTGEEIIAEYVSEDETTITVKNGLVVLPTQTGSVGFAPWATVSTCPSRRLLTSFPVTIRKGSGACS